MNIPFGLRFVLISPSSPRFARVRDGLVNRITRHYYIRMYPNSLADATKRGPREQIPVGRRIRTTASVLSLALARKNPLARRGHSEIRQELPAPVLRRRNPSPQMFPGLNRASNQAQHDFDLVNTIRHTGANVLDKVICEPRGFPDNILTRRRGGHFPFATSNCSMSLVLRIR